MTRSQEAFAKRLNAIVKTRIYGSTDGQLDGFMDRTK